MVDNAFSHKSRWKFCVFVSLAMAFLSLTPQFLLWANRGRDWNGAYVSAFVDEPFYASYVSALIDGRSRRNDPFGATDDSPKKPLPESLYSIQFVPAYVVALPARCVGISASMAFVLLTPIVVFLASVAVFWLLNSITRDSRIAAAGTFFVLCVGGFFGSYGIFRQPIDIAFPVLPFTRRYEPAVPFPFYILFAEFVWIALTSEAKSRSVRSALIVAVIAVLLIFSYLYLWTAAIAWLGCIGLLWILLRPAEARRAILVLLIIATAVGFALIPYIHLISRRAGVTDEQQIMVATRIPELLHVHEVIAALMLVALTLAVMRGKVTRSDPRFIFAASIGLLPFVVFNQQIITGKTLQAFHFEIYSVNYYLAIGIVVTLSLFWSRVPQRLLVWAAALSLSWGLIAVGLPARTIGVPGAVVNDKRIPVMRRLKELSYQDGTETSRRTTAQSAALVFSPSVPLIMSLPSWTSQGTLLDITGGDCAGITREERKRQFYMHLYYANVELDALRQALTGPVPPSPDSLLLVRSVVFGHARIYQGLSSRFVPVQPDEIDREVQSYETFKRSFSQEEALKRPITYAVIPADDSFDFNNLDRWYERDAGERVGDYVLYRLKLRP